VTTLANKISCARSNADYREFSGSHSTPVEQRNRCAFEIPSLLKAGHAAGDLVKLTSSILVRQLKSLKMELEALILHTQKRYRTHYFKAIESHRDK